MSVKRDILLTGRKAFLKRAAKDSRSKVFNTAESWYDANQRYLMASVETIREELFLLGV